jgi:predicted RNA binding protein YcfA (HicA-like mRNA interferase family)
MPSMSYRELAALLREHGCQFVRSGKGDHEIWFSPLTRRKFTIPRRLKGEGTLRSILKAAGVRAE